MTQTFASVIPCDTCDGALKPTPGRGLVCSNGCEALTPDKRYDRPVAERKPLQVVRPVEPALIAPVDLRPRWMPCGCIRTPENYVTRTSAGVTYSGCRDCWEGIAS